MEQSAAWLNQKLRKQTRLRPTSARQEAEIYKPWENGAKEKSVRSLMRSSGDDT